MRFMSELESCSEDRRPIRRENPVLQYRFYALTGLNRIHMRIEQQDRCGCISFKFGDQIPRIAPCPVSGIIDKYLGSHAF